MEAVGISTYGHFDAVAVESNPFKDFVNFAVCFRTLLQAMEQTRLQRQNTGVYHLILC